MNRLNLRAAGTLCLVYLVALALARGGVTRALGAHPYWDLNVVLIGAVPALLLWGLARIWPRAAMACALALVIASAISARYGKMAFAASFAENALAGRAWFIGWIMLSGALVALVALVLERFARRR